MINCLSVFILQVLSPGNGYVPRRRKLVMINCLSLFILQVLSPRNGYVLAAKEIGVGYDKLSIYVYVAGSVP